MRFLRTNTAVIVSVGPFYDKTDGVTPETALTITNERITLVADTDDGSAPTLVLDNVTGATSGTANDLNYITGQDNGMMQMELSAANTNRLGRMMLTVTDAANHVPVFHEFMVMPALVYDTFFAASGGATFPAATLASTTNITAGTITTATNVTTVNGLAANVITAAATAADFTTEIQSGLATAAALDAVDNFLDTEIAAILAAVDTEVAAIKAVTDLLPNGGALTSLATAAALDAVDNFVDTEIAALTTAVADLPTNAELATALADNFDPATDEVLANVKKVNSVTIVGDGSATPFNV